MEFQMELKCSVQNYAWGKLGSSSSVARLHKQNISEKVPYAELWMGTHRSGPSFLKELDMSLYDFIAQNPTALSPEEIETFGIGLPFLFKVLSVAKALSIQAHPNKKHAELLHQLKPEHYKDANHKPEMTVPIFGDFEALCGFRPVEEVAEFVDKVPSLSMLIGDSNVSLLKVSAPNAVKESFSTLMTCPPNDVKAACEGFLLNSDVEESKKDDILVDLFKRIYKDFPDDVGCFCIYFMNFIHLKEGEAMFLGPNVPHAYLYGDCIECMACSDNVVRAGLTPKFKDVEVLCEMLDYESKSKGSYLVQWEREDLFTEVCKPPVPDFALARIKIDKINTEYQLLPRTGSIVIIITGEGVIDEGKNLEQGTILFIPAFKKLKIHSKSGLFLAYQAFTNVQSA
ncbi:mannose-6-phosphate isomerase-like isoform X2 [Artemia franciscana]|uniref:mannose-6-phosphate isomerase-like isoform X2 n=1 Tax=Artemia franciscana TaxID=6661 RepID=UPI0032DA9686